MNTSFGSLAKIGISTTSNYLEGGKLEIDEEKLRAAIEEDPNGIYNLFMADGEKSQLMERRQQYLLRKVVLRED